MSAEQVVFSSAYGQIPRSFSYLVMPFLLCAAGVLFVRAVWFGEGVPLGGQRLPPEWVAYGICPLLVILCGMLAALMIYRRWRPLTIEVSNRGVRLPQSPLSRETRFIEWEHLEARFSGRNVAGYRFYEIHCQDDRNSAEVRVASVLFRDFDDFATFAMLMGQHMGQEWSIEGFRPGSLRGTSTVPLLPPPHDGGSGEPGSAAANGGSAPRH
jgi:hypothetical protein